MRILFDVLRDGLAAINTAGDRMSAAQRELASGRRLNAISDDPNAAQQAVVEHAALGTLDAYTRSAGSAASRLGAADGVLTHYIETLTSAMVAATGAQGSSADATARSAAADAVRGFRDMLLADINTELNGSRLFAGSRVDQAAYVQSGATWTYQGDGSAVQIDVARSRQVAVSFDGAALAKGADAQDVFTELDALATAIETGDAAGMATGIAALERAFDRANRMQSAIGLDENRVDDALAHVASLRLAAEGRRAGLEDADISEAIVRLQQADSAYRAALGAVSSAERLSLLDYLR